MYLCSTVNPMLRVDFHASADFYLLIVYPHNKKNHRGSLPFRLPQIIMMSYFMGKELFFKVVLNFCSFFNCKVSEILHGMEEISPKCTKKGS